jgi:opacity protein-like surface antigen
VLIRDFFLIHIVSVFLLVSLSYSQDLKPEAPLGLAPISQPYALPWQLRSVYAANLLRLDSASAFYKDKNGKSGGTTVASLLTGSYKLIPDLAVLARIGMVNNNPPAGAASATSLMNPLLGGIFSQSLSDEFKMSFFMGVTLPVGSGGGNSPKPALQSANSAAVLARSAMDNALLAVNYFAIIPGVDIAYISKGVTVQLEATLLQLTRVRGENVDKDSTRTNFTSGLGLGYSISSRVSAIGELRYQRWLKNSTVSSAPKPAKENLSFAIGPRFNLKFGKLTLKPGIAYAQGIIGPMANSGHTSPTNSQKIIFIDLPLIF